MSFCPKCRTQWNDDQKTCPDCGSVLWSVVSSDEVEEDAYEPDDAAQLDPYEPVFLTQSTDERELELIEKLLQAERIPFFARDLESGEYMRIYMGFSIYGKQIFVRAKDYAACSQMLSRLVGEYEDDELEAAYDAFMDSAEPEDIPQADSEQAGGGHRMLLGFFVFFAVLIVLMILVTTLAGK